MKTLIVYEAEDGRQFSDGDACLDYEQNCRATKEANEKEARYVTNHLCDKRAKEAMRRARARVQLGETQ